jgi:Flp pilus assembly protein TadG
MVAGSRSAACAGDRTLTPRRPSDQRLCATAPQRRGRFAQLCTSQDGAAAVEFALVAVPFLALTFGIIEVGIDFMVNSQIDAATQKVVENIRSGAVVISGMSASDFKTNVLCPQMVGMTCSSVRLNVETIQQWTKWNSISKTAITTQNWCPGGSGDRVLVQVAYPVPLSTMIWAGSPSLAEPRYYIAAAGFRNDPYGIAASTAPGC